MITLEAWDDQTLPVCARGDGEVQLWTNSWVSLSAVCHVSVGPTATLAAAAAAMCHGKGGTEAAGEACHTIGGRYVSMVTRPAYFSRQIPPTYISHFFVR